MDIRNMITFQHSDLKVWTREDKNIMYYVDTDGGEGGPEWKDVRIRQTFEAQTGYMIEFLIVHPGEKHLCKKLPPGVTHTKTVFRFVDQDSKRNKKIKHNPNKSHYKKNNKKKKGKKNKNVNSGNATDIPKAF